MPSSDLFASFAMDMYECDQSVACKSIAKACNLQQLFFAVVDEQRGKALKNLILGLYTSQNAII
jgi:hypothetical protein